MVITFVKSGCAFGEMQSKNTDCNKCPYTIARHSLENMFEQIK